MANPWEKTMIVTTTNTIEGHRITAYKGVVVGEAIMGANVVRDLFAQVTDIVGGRSGAYERKLQDAREVAFRELEQRARLDEPRCRLLRVEEAELEAVVTGA